MRSGSNSSLATLSILGAIALSILPALADKVPASASNDIFVGFRSTDNPGSSFAYLVKVGNYNTFRDVPEGSSITVATVNIGTTANPNIVSIGNLGTDLSGVNGLGQGFGANWSNREDLQWGVFGVAGATNNSVIFASRLRPSASVASSAWEELNLTQRNATGNQIRTVLTSEATSDRAYNSLEATPNSPVAAFQPIGAGTYIDEVSGSPDFGTISGFSSIEASFGNGPSGALLDLYRLGPAGGATPPLVHVGYFSISASGVITFTKPSSTPQPDPNADDDGDGVTNGQEAIAGTNPNDASDFFRVDSLTRSSGNSLVSFKPAAGRTYTLRYSENLQPPWDEIATWPSGTTPPSTHSFTDNDPVRNARPKGFYQIVVSQP